MVQIEDPVTATWLELQGWQVAEPGEDAYLPASQSAQAVVPMVAWGQYLPVWHWEHAVDAPVLER